MPRISPTAVLAAALLASAPLVADEGMWMPQQVPRLAAELQSRGLALDPNQFADLLGDPMGAIVSLGGCSASFVSPQGLVVTNHHCSTASIQFNSTADKDLITNGFLAKTMAEELPTSPGSYVYVTSGIRDVTADVLGALAPKKKKDPALTDLERAKRIEHKRRELVDTCEKAGGVRCTVGTFFEGSQFLLFTQTEIKDVRLVYAPGEGIGNYGGEVDNWMWPRHTGDFSFLRAYVGPDGKPAEPSPANVPYQPKHWLKVAQEGVKAGDLVWIAGYPGRTFRYRTAEEVKEAQTFSMPTYIRYAQTLNGLLAKESARGRDVEIKNYARVRGAANAMKKFEGILLSMRGGSVDRQRQEREAALLQREATREAVSTTMAEIADLDALKTATRERDAVLEWLDRSSPMLAQAVKLYRLSIERPKADLDRAEGFRQRDMTRFDQAVARAQKSFEAASDRATLRYAVEQATTLPADQRIPAVDAALAATGKTEVAAQTEAFLDTLYAGSKIGDLAERQAMAKQTTAQLDARGDSLLAFAKALLPMQLAREERDQTYDGGMLRVRPTYLAGLEGLTPGRPLYPDANSTLRVTFGTVIGYTPRDAVRYEPFTTLPGVVAKATSEKPFVSPANLLEAAKLPIPNVYLNESLGNVPVDFLSTCDITGGNSGSATLNARGELVGLAFDGNWEGVGSDYLFDATVTRTISVDAVYMRWVMDAVDGAHNLLTEMGLPIVYGGAMGIE